jgi:hypothetical protein
MRYSGVHVEDQCSRYNPDPPVTMTPERNAKNQAVGGGAETQARSSVNSSSSPRKALHTRNWHLSTTPLTHISLNTMASIIGRAAFRATRPLRSSGINAGSENAASAASREADKNALKQGARKDPELYVRRRCLCVLPDT